MRRQTFLALTITLLNVVTVLLISEEAGITQILISSTGVAVIALFVYFIFRDSITDWSQGTHSMETDRQLLVHDKLADQRCNYCGLYELEITRGALVPPQYCSRGCWFAHRRLVFLITGNTFVILASFASSYLLVVDIIISVLLLTAGFVGMEKHYPKFIYRNLGGKEEQRRREKQHELTEHSKFDVRYLNDKVHVKGLDLVVPVCCFQTARLQEQYCACGRAVPSDLLVYLQET